MKSLVFDTSTIISIATNNLLWVLPELKKRFKGEFYIAPAVKQEVLDVPLKSKRYKLEAMQILSLMGEGHIKVFRNNAKNARELLDVANHIFRTKDTWIKIVHDAEIESLAAAIDIKADAYVIDERNTRMLIETPENLGQLLEDKLHTKIEVNYENLERFKEHIKGVNIIRSAELMTVAYELGIMDEYLRKEERDIINIDLKKTLIDGMLWGLKLKGCAITQNEINEIVRIKG
jgi:predicted nucleic acid-binding protein